MFQDTKKEPSFVTQHVFIIIPFSQVRHAAQRASCRTVCLCLKHQEASHWSRGSDSIQSFIQRRADRIRLRPTHISRLPFCVERTQGHPALALCRSRSLTITEAGELRCITERLRLLYGNEHVCARMKKERFAFEPGVHGEHVIKSNDFG